MFKKSRDLISLVKSFVFEFFLNYVLQNAMCWGETFLSNKYFSMLQSMRSFIKYYKVKYSSFKFGF